MKWVYFVVGIVGAMALLVVAIDHQAYSAIAPGLLVFGIGFVKGLQHLGTAAARKLRARGAGLPPRLR